MNSKNIQSCSTCVEVMIVLHKFYGCEFIGNEISALKSVPAAVYSFLRSMRPIKDIPDEVLLHNLN